MSYATFLKALRKTPRKWRITKDGRIRLGRKCPIEATGKKERLGQCIRALGIRPVSVSAIIRAADRCTPWRDDTRRDLLKACGLKERTR